MKRYSNGELLERCMRYENQIGDLQTALEAAQADNERLTCQLRAFYRLVNKYAYLGRFEEHKQDTGDSNDT